MHFLKWDWFITSKEKGGLGLRSLEDLNKALVAKLAWRFLKHQDSMWSRILHAKYLRGISFWTAKKPQRCTSTWAAMLSIRPQLKEGCCWLIGKGNHVRVWSDPWIPSLTGNTPSLPTHNVLNIQFVRDLMNTEGTAWNAELVRQVFEPFEAEQVLNIYINRTEEDRLLWTPTTHGDFSAQSFQKVLTANAGESSLLNDDTFPWKKFWAVKKIAPRILNFTWRVVRGGIGVLHKIGRFIEGVPTDCLLCDDGLESISHLFLHCHVTQAILFACPLSLRLRNNNLGTVKDLLASWLLIPDNNYTFTLGVCILWAIWKGRNDLVFEKKPINIHSIIALGMHWFNMFYYYEESDIQFTIPNQTTSVSVRNQQWSPPLAGVTKLNVDAAWRTNSSLCAVVARNHAGKFVCAQADVADSENPLLAEASGFLLAVRLAAFMKLNRIIIEGDAESVVLALNGASPKVPWRLIRYIDQIKLLVSQFDQVSFSYVPREANEVAHLLAAYAVRHNIHCRWISSQPSCISSRLSLEEIVDSSV